MPPLRHGNVKWVKDEYPHRIPIYALVPSALRRRLSPLRPAPSIHNLVTRYLIGLSSTFLLSTFLPSLHPILKWHQSATSASLQSVSHPQTVDPGVEKELEHIRTVIRNSPSARTTLLESSLGTVEEVLCLVKDADWLHFACHGIQDDTDAINSGLCLADRHRLKVSDIIVLSRPRGGLAFLSACQTAMGDKDLSNEVIHITAGMLFAGYGRVIGTMWPISDQLAPVVARDVYRELFRYETSLSGGRTSVAQSYCACSG